MIIKNYLYNKTVEITFHEETHTYYINQKRLPSVTTVLSIVNKPMLVNWAAKMAVESMQQSFQPGVVYDEIQLKDAFALAKKAHWQRKTDAGSLGNVAHKWVEDYIRGKNPKMPIHQQLNASVNQFLKWTEENKVKFLLSEQMIYSKQHNYVGTLDFICKVGDKMYIGDLKTSKNIYYNSMGSQVAAYKIAREEEFPDEKYDGIFIVRVGMVGDIQCWEHTDTKVFENNFLNALELYKTEEIIKQLEQDGQFNQNNGLTSR